MRYSKPKYSHAQYIRDVDELIPYIYYVFAYLFAKRECDLNPDSEHIGTLLRAQNDLVGCNRTVFKNFCDIHRYK